MKEPKNYRGSPFDENLYYEEENEIQGCRTITLKVSISPSPPHDEITLINSDGDKFISKSEELNDFLYNDYCKS